MSYQFRAGVPTILLQYHDARDEEPLREPARLLGRVWEDKRYT